MNSSPSSAPGRSKISSQFGTTRWTTRRTRCVTSFSRWSFQGIPVVVIDDLHRPVAWRVASEETVGVDHDEPRVDVEAAQNLERKLVTLAETEAHYVVVKVAGVEECIQRIAWAQGEHQAGVAEEHIGPSQRRQRFIVEAEIVHVLWSRWPPRSAAR